MVDTSCANVPPPQASKGFYRPELDALRFLAFLLVFLHHTLPLGAGPATVHLQKSIATVVIAGTWASGFGLSLFFTLSAYLICELLLRERQAIGFIRARQFYIRRILRIWPLYFAGLAIALICAVLPGGDPRAIEWTAWSALLLGNWFVVFHGYASSPMMPLWSISVEEQFYLLVPWAVKYFDQKRLRLAAIALIISANIWLYFLGKAHTTDAAVWTNSFVRFEDFAAGILLCLLLHGRTLKLSDRQRLGLLAGSAFCWFYPVYGLGLRSNGNVCLGSWHLMGAYNLTTLGCCLLLLAFLGVNKRVLPGWFVYLGRISYGLYVFHELAIKITSSLLSLHHTTVGSLTMLIKGLTAIGLTILLASLSYKYFESPFLRLKQRHEVIESRPV